MKTCFWREAIEAGVISAASRNSKCYRRRAVTGSIGRAGSPLPAVWDSHDRRPRGFALSVACGNKTAN